MDNAKSIGCALLKKPAIMAAMSDWLAYHKMDRGHRAEKLVSLVRHPDPRISLQALDRAMKAGDDFPSQKHQVAVLNVHYAVDFGGSRATGTIVDIESEDDED